MLPAKQTTVERFIHALHEHRVVSVVVVAGIVVVALGTFTESLERILDFSQRHILRARSQNALDEPNHETAFEDTAEPAWEAKIELNSGLPAFSVVKQRLERAAIPIADVFQDPATVSPERFLVSFGRRVRVETLQQVLRLVSDLGVDSIQFLPGRPYEGRITVGSYGYMKAHVVHGPYLFEQEPVASLDPDFLAAVLQPDITLDSLADLVRSRARHEEILLSGQHARTDSK